jgi:Protein of unknown function (DUF3277).
MAVKTYNPKDVLIIVGPVIVEGFADGTFVNIARDNPSWNKAIGSDGEGARARSNDQGGSVTLTLMQTSASNPELSALALLDEQTGDGVVPLLVTDRSGTSLYEAETAWIEKPADSPFAREIETREWVIQTDNLKMLVGDN